MSRKASQTALLVAGYRARATRAGLCDDPWAEALAGGEGRALTERYDLANAHMELWIALRTRFFDDNVRAFVRRGTSQIVVLGAGLDSRAARLAAPGVTFFEVDQPASTEERRRRIDGLAGYPRDAAVSVPCDFEHEDFLTRLRASGFRPDRPALFLWEGVVYYLPEAAVRATARRVAEGCHPASALLFDLISKRMVDGTGLPERDRAARDIVAELGEPIRFGTSDPLPLLAEEGFRHVRSVTFDALGLSYAGTYVRERAFRFQSVVLASRELGAPPWG